MMLEINDHTILGGVAKQFSAYIRKAIWPPTTFMYNTNETSKSQYLLFG